MLYLVFRIFVALTLQIPWLATAHTATWYQLDLNQPIEDTPWRFYLHSRSDPSFNLGQNSTQIHIPQSHIAIIIDDIGHQQHSSYQSAHLPGNVTLAVLPFSPYASAVASWVRDSGKELMMHIPMEPENHLAWDEGLTRSMGEYQLRNRLAAMLDSVPSISGINNHMGSALTQNATAMGWVMDELALRQLYFIDSRTSAKTQALKTAKRWRLPSAKRDVFLDNDRDPEAIAVQFDKLLTLAEKRGSAIAIGHPYRETLHFLAAIEPLLRERKIKLVPVSELLKKSKSHAISHNNVEQIAIQPKG